MPGSADASEEPSENGTAEAPDDEMHNRADESPIKLWVSITADRWIVTTLLVGVVLGTLLALAYISPWSETVLRTTDSIDALFQALLTATITGVTLVLTLNQLVLSQELGPLGDQRERMEGALSFRSDAAGLLDEPVSPADPARFLRALVEAAGDSAATLETEVLHGPNASDDCASDVAELTTAVTDNADRVASGLEGAKFGEFDALASALDFNYAWKIVAAKRVKTIHADELSTAAETALGELIDALELYGPAREHVKTLYFQWELVDLSRKMLTTSVPALLVASTMIVFFDASGYAWTIAGTSTLPAFVAVTITVALAPFLVLFASVLRIATVAKHTLSIGPFILRNTDAGHDPGGSE